MVGRRSKATQPPRPCMQTVWNVLTIRCTRKLLKRLGAEAIIDPPSPTNRLGNWYAKLVFVRRVPLIICISEPSLLPVIVEARDASSFSPRFRDAARSVLQGIGAGPDTVVRNFWSVMIPWSRATPIFSVPDFQWGLLTRGKQTQSASRFSRSPLSICSISIANELSMGHASHTGCASAGR